MRLLALLAAGLFVGPLVAAPVPKEKAKDDDAIVGTWLVEKIDLGVQGVPPPEGVGKVKLRFEKGGKVVTVDPDGKESGENTYKVDAMASPKRLDMSGDMSEQLGVYELEGDTLKVATNGGLTKERPTEVKADGKGIFVMTLKRVTDEKKDEPKKDK